MKSSLITAVIFILILKGSVFMKWFMGQVLMLCKCHQDKRIIYVETTLLWNCSFISAAYLRYQPQTFQRQQAIRIHISSSSLFWRQHTLSAAWPRSGLLFVQCALTWLLCDLWAKYPQHISTCNIGQDWKVCKWKAWKILKQPPP